MNARHNPDKYNLNPWKTNVMEGVSIFTAIKNRKESFEEPLKTWLAQDQIDEIIIVDWDSNQSLVQMVEKYQNGKIFLAVVKDQPKWILSFAYNLAARLTTRNHILKIDADVKILPGFFDMHVIEPGKFYCGNWRIRRNDNEMHLNGITFLHRDDFFKVNGYNEYIKFYGWDDSDLYRRLETAGVKRNDFDLDTLYHIPHGNRTLFQDQRNYLQSIPEEERATFATFVNRHLGNTYGKWSPSRKMMEFSITPQNDHLITCCQSGIDENPITPALILESETVALRERLELLGTTYSEDLLKKLTREELLELYMRHFLKKPG
ncbi:MAG: galactosyltransferase-related protein [Bacteroidales bacterium]|nr:galactosyltransferase-related protein [Bacteroidales bacterium]